MSPQMQEDLSDPMVGEELTTRRNAEDTVESIPPTASNDDTITEEQPMTRRVSFGTICIHEHAMILGENPGCAFGPPLTLDWEAQDCHTFNLEEYEATKPLGRDQAECALPTSYRMEILRRSGYSRNQITQLTKPVNIARAQRRATVQSMRLAVLHELMETIARKSRNILSLGRRKREERRFLEKWCGASANKQKVSQDNYPTAAFTEEDNSFGEAADGGVAMEA